jgi:hypothetical protein
MYVNILSQMGVIWQKWLLCGAFLGVRRTFHAYAFIYFWLVMMMA